MHIVIGITDTESQYDNYPIWIKGGSDEIEIRKLTPGNLAELKNCQGVVLSGGIDTHPRFYGSQNVTYPRAPKEFNEARDEFELAVFKYACEHSVPVLAICRGMQLVNIALGGTMIQDIEASGKSNHRKTDGKDGIHEITLLEGSLLATLCGATKGTVNSAHHQALGQLADDLVATAWSSDGIIEAVEWKKPLGKTFLLAVQWHPERLNTIISDNPLGVSIRAYFLQMIRKSE